MDCHIQREHHAGDGVRRADGKRERQQKTGPAVTHAAAFFPTSQEQVQRGAQQQQGEAVGRQIAAGQRPLRGAKREQQGVPHRRRLREEQERDLVLHPDRQSADGAGAPQFGERPPAQQIAREKGRHFAPRKEARVGCQRSRQRKPALHQSQQGQHHYRGSQRKIAIPVTFAAAFHDGPGDGGPIGWNALQSVIRHARRVRHEPIDTRTAMLQQAQGSCDAPVRIVGEERRTDAVHQPHGGEQT